MEFAYTRRTGIIVMRVQQIEVYNSTSYLDELTMNLFNNIILDL